MNTSVLRFFAILIFPALVATACAPTQVRPVNSASQLSGNEFALVAFSADSAPPLAFRGLEIVTFSENNQPRKAGEVEIYPEGGPGQLFLYEFAVETARFGAAQFQYEADFWESISPGPEFKVKPGTLTYLGRIQMPLVQMGTYADSGRDFPAGARLVMTDASEEDLSRLTLHFPSIATMPLNKAIPTTWSDSENVRLRYAPYRNKRPKKTDGPDPLHDPPVPTEQIFEPTEIPP